MHHIKTEVRIIIYSFDWFEKISVRARSVFHLVFKDKKSTQIVILWQSARQQSLQVLQGRHEVLKCATEVTHYMSAKYNHWASQWKIF